MKKKQGVIIVTSLVCSLFLTGCALKDNIIEKQNAEPINTQALKVNTLENELQSQNAEQINALALKVNRLENELQSQNAEQINTLALKVNALEHELQSQKNTDKEMTQTINKLYMEQNELNKQTVKHYSIKAKDTLYSIARKFNVSPETLLQLNPQIENKNILLVGQTIKITK